MLQTDLVLTVVPSLPISASMSSRQPPCEPSEYSFISGRSILADFERSIAHCQSGSPSYEYNSCGVVCGHDVRDISQCACCTFLMCSIMRLASCRRLSVSRKMHRSSRTGSFVSACSDVNQYPWPQLRLWCLATSPPTSFFSIPDPPPRPPYNRQIDLPSTPNQTQPKCR